MLCIIITSQIYIRNIQEEIESERLLFRRDLNPAADVGLRRDVADMLVLNYSHVWLRLGLEVCGLPSLPFVISLSLLLKGMW